MTPPTTPSCDVCERPTRMELRDGTPMCHRCWLLQQAFALGWDITVIVRDYPTFSVQVLADWRLLHAQAKAIAEAIATRRAGEVERVDGAIRASTLQRHESRRRYLDRVEVEPPEGVDLAERRRQLYQRTLSEIREDTHDGDAHRTEARRVAVRD